jgi:hypothetical protein
MLDQGTVAIKEHGTPGALAVESAPPKDRSSVVLGLVVGSLRTDVPMVPIPDPPPHASREPRERVETEIEGIHLCDFPIGIRVQHVDPAVREIARRRSRLLDKIDDPVFGPERGDPACAWVGRMKQQHRDGIWVASVILQQAIEVDVAEIVGVDGDDLVGIIAKSFVCR